MAARGAFVIAVLLAAGTALHPRAVEEAPVGAVSTGTATRTSPRSTISIPHGATNDVTRDLARTFGAAIGGGAFRLQYHNVQGRCAKSLGGTPTGDAAAV